MINTNSPSFYTVGFNNNNNKNKTTKPKCLNLLKLLDTNKLI